MAHTKGFGVKSTANRRMNQARNGQTWEGMPQLDLETCTQLWQAGLLNLKSPNGFKPRSLTPEEKHWLDRAALTEYIAPEQQGQQAIFYTSSPPAFNLKAADWYLRPDDYWNQSPIPLQEMTARFPASLFQLSASGQPPGFYPDRTPDYTAAQEAIMRSIFRETVRLGWSLPQYKWFILGRLRKTTAQVTHEEAIQVLEVLQEISEEV